MGFRPVNQGNTTWVRVEDLNEGQTFDVTLAKKINTKYGEAYVFMDDELNELAFSGGKMRWLMQHIQPGTRILLTYLGQKLIEAGPQAGNYCADWSADEWFDDDEPVNAPGLPSTRNEPIEDLFGGTEEIPF